MYPIDEFRKEMEEPKRIYTEELEKFAKKYDFLGDFTIIEEPDIDTLDHIYYFESIKETSEETLELTCDEIYEHMVKFSKANGIDGFSENTYIFYKSD